LYENDKLHQYESVMVKNHATQINNDEKSSTQNHANSFSKVCVCKCLGLRVYFASNPSRLARFKFLI